MAEIPIQEKRGGGGSKLPLILGGLLLLLLLGWCLTRDRDEPAVADTAVTTAPLADTPTAVPADTLAAPGTGTATGTTPRP